MRATAKRSSLPDIRTTGFVQLDSSSGKIVSCEDWSPDTFASNLQGSEADANNSDEEKDRATTAEAAPPAVLSADPAGTANVGVKVEEQVAILEEAGNERKSLRHFSRKSSRRRSETEEAQKGEMKGQQEAVFDGKSKNIECDVSDASPLNSDLSGSMNSNHGASKGTTDLHQLPESMKYNAADDESVDTKLKCNEFNKPDEEPEADHSEAKVGRKFRRRGHHHKVEEGEAAQQGRRWGTRGHKAWEQEAAEQQEQQQQPGEKECRERQPVEEDECKDKKRAHKVEDEDDEAKFAEHGVKKRRRRSGGEDCKMEKRRRKPDECDETGKCKEESSRGDDLKALEACLDFLEHCGLFKEAVWIDPSSEAAKDPGYVGDGTMTLNCKLCGQPEEDAGTLICDVCEETFHIACCNPRPRTIPRDDRWFCGTCSRKRKRKNAELKMYLSGYYEEKFPPSWKIDRTKIRGWDLQRKERRHVRIGSMFQAEVPEWTGACTEPCIDPLRSDYPGTEVSRTWKEKVDEKILAEAHLAAGITPKDWLPVKRLPEGDKENWLQCQNLLYEEGDMLPDGIIVDKDIICGKWRRAPLHIVADDSWECSCAVVWDPRHADCAVAQEISTEDIRKRPKARMQAPSETKACWTRFSKEQEGCHFFYF